MKQIEIIGTRFTICISSENDLLTDLRAPHKGYDYVEVLGVNSSSMNLIVMDRGGCCSPCGCSEYMWLRRETKTHSGTLGVLSGPDYRAVLRMSLHYANKIQAATNAHRKTYYHGVLENLLVFSGSQSLIHDFQDSNVGISDLIKNIMSSISAVHGTSGSVPQRYDRYSMTDFLEDLVTDGSKLIMDDSICPYQWKGRTTQGFGNIKPIIESTDLYPTYKITGIQGNQTNANLSLRFDFKAMHSTGTATKVLEISRNIMVVNDGNRFQKTLALHVSDNLKKKLEGKGVIDASLPGPGDILVDLGKISVSSRKYQRNRMYTSFLDAACMYHVCKSELELVEAQIQWTPEETTKAAEKAQASKDYWALNSASRVTGGSGKKIYTVSIGRPSPLVKMTQEELRKKRIELLTSQEKSYRTVTSMIFNYLVSKKSIREFFGLSKKGVVTGKTVSYKRVITSPLGKTYNCDFKFK